MNHSDPNLDSYARTLVQLRRAILKSEQLDDATSLEKLRSAESNHPYSDPAVVERAKEITLETGERLWSEEAV